MPTILRLGPYRFHFYSDEKSEPAHIHVATADAECKYWLRPSIRLARNKGIPAHELREIEKLVFQHQQLFLEKYHEFHGR
jgi:hypothetical protein